MLGMLRLERGLDTAVDRQAVRRFALCAAAIDRTGARTSRRRESRTGAAAMIAGDYPEWLDPSFAASSARGARRRVQRWRARAARSARQHAEVRIVKRWRPNWPNTIRNRPAGRQWGCASRRARRQKSGHPGRAGLHQGHGRNPGRGLAARGACCRALCRASRWSISAPVPAARRLALAAMMEQQGPDLRDRQRQAPACPDPRPA